MLLAFDSFSEMLRVGVHDFKIQASQVTQYVNLSASFSSLKNGDIDSIS